MIDIKTYAVPKEGTTTKIISTQYSESESTPVNPFEPHYLWGQYFDDTEDIDGDMQVNGTINADKLNAISIEVGNASIDNLSVGYEEANSISTTNFSAQLATIVAAYIRELSSDNITTENLTVTKSAHFFELIIDKIKAAGGAVLLTPADGFKIDIVQDVSDGKKLLFRANDGDRAIRNMWRVNDQAICQTFNQAQVGTNYNISNKYWWSLVTGVGTDTIEGEDYHYIIVSNTTKDGTLNPEVGDEVAMLGYRGSDDAQRQSAIYISAYASLDDELIAPLICQYRGIDDFDLASHKYTWFAAGTTAKGQSNNIMSNEIRGNLRLSNGQSVEDAMSGGQSLNINSYKILPNTTAISKGSTIRPSTITASFLINHNGEVTESNTVPNGLTFSLYGSAGINNQLVYSWNQGSTVSRATDQLVNYDYLYMILTDNTTTYDRTSIAIIADGQDGGAAAAGGHWEFAYKESKTKPNKPTGYGNTDGWSSTPSTPDYANGYYLWMSQCFVSGTGTYGTWTDPIRFTGDNGKAGEDGTKTEFIYSVNTSTTTAPTISYNPYNNKTRDDDDFVPNGWTDNPTGAQAQNEVEWVATRTKENGVWSDFSAPAIWSKWGEKGTDGDGYEYIYKATNTSATPLNPANITQPSSTSTGQTKSDDDFVPNGWSDEPVQLSPSALYEWVSTRKKDNGRWQAFTEPKLWAQYSAPGSNGQDGNTWVFIYYNSPTKPTKPNDHVGIGALPAGWSTTWTEPNYNAGEYVWMSQTEVVGNVYGIWSEPIRITGQNGRAGEDGTKIEFIYKLTTQNIAPQVPATVQQDDYYGNWTDNPTGVDETNQYEWVSTREKEQGIWSAFSTPAIWSKWGEKGMDGDGYEYIYTRTATNQIANNPTPQDWQTNTAYQSSDVEYIPNGWSDDPVSPTQQYPTVYVSVRKRHNGVWQPFSNPAIWARWIEAGEGQQGADGQDGENAKQDLMLDCGSYCTITYNSTTKKYILTRRLAIAVFHYDGNTRIQVTENTTPSMSDYAIWWKYNTRSGNMVEDDGLSITNDGVWFTDYDESIQYNSLSGMPQFATYQLRSSQGEVLDQLIVYVKMREDAVFEVTADQIQSYVSGVVETINGTLSTIQNSISTLTQNYNSITATVQGITSTINGITGDLTQLEEDFAQLTLDLNGFMTQVYKKTEVDGLISETESLIQQTADQIKLMVNNTGIDIVNNKITLNANNTIINGNLILQQIGNNSQGLIFRNSNYEDSLKISTERVPALSEFIAQYPNYPHMLIGTNGFGIQTSSYRYMYCTDDSIAIQDGNAGGPNNEYKINMLLRQSGGMTGQIKDYIGSKEFGFTANSTANSAFLTDYTAIQHNGVRRVNPSHNYNYSWFLVSSKDRLLLCDPNGNNEVDSNLSNRAVTLKFDANCVGHFYFIKRMHDVGRIYIDGYVYQGTQNESNTPRTGIYIDDNYLWMAIVVDGLYTINGDKKMTIILNRIGA